MRDDDCLAAGLPRRGTPFNFRDNASFPLSPSRRTADQRLFPIERYLCLLKTFAAGSSWINVEREGSSKMERFPQASSIDASSSSFVSYIILETVGGIVRFEDLNSEFYTMFNVSYFSCFLDINK